MTAKSALTVPDWGFFITQMVSECPITRHPDWGKTQYHLLAIKEDCLISPANDGTVVLSWLIERAEDLDCESDSMIELIINVVN